MREVVLEVCGNPESKEVMDLARRLSEGYEVFIRRSDSNIPVVRGPNGESFHGLKEIKDTFFPD